MTLCCLPEQVQKERDDLYQKFTTAINEVQQKTGFKNLLLERKLQGLLDLLEKKEVELSEVLAASNLDPSALSLVTHKLEVLGPVRAGFGEQSPWWILWNTPVPILHGCRWHITSLPALPGLRVVLQGTRLCLEWSVWVSEFGTDLSLWWGLF